MRTFATAASLAAMTVVIAGLAASPAQAACTRLAFSVNDYGKDGPTKDALKLLDTYIAKWMGERGIKTYRTGKKDVSCELFLNLIVFDEHTCKAEATVCWDGPPVAPQSTPAQAAATAPPGAAIKRTAVPGALRASPVYNANSGAAKPPVDTIAVAPSAPPPAPVTNQGLVETGAVGAGRPVSPPSDVPAKATPARADSATDQALQAAQRAAAAAERAAAAAERAAAAATAAEKARP